MTRRLGAAVAALILIVAPAHAAPAAAAPTQDRCDPSDLSCRLDRIERRLDRVIDMLERLDRGGGSRGRGNDGVEMSTSEVCGSRNCVDEAVRLCRAAGFQRGLPTAVEDMSWGGRLTRAQCFE